MAQIIWSEPALNDLDEIAEYIALDKPNAAKKLVANVFTKVERLENFPKSGRKLPELNESRYRKVVFPPCRVFYRIEDETIYIIYVLRNDKRLRKYILEARH